MNPFWRDRRKCRRSSSSLRLSAGARRVQDFAVLRDTVIRKGEHGERQEVEKEEFESLAPRNMDMNNKRKV